VLWIPLLGLMTGLLAAKTGLLLMAVAWGILMAFNLITLPVEFDASRRAKLVLARMGFIQPGAEQAAVSQVLNAAGWTYVAAFVSSAVYFLWHLLPLLTGRSDDR
ncbi:MAG TPA: zinc metallopeptidase, partial [Dongiaceae bacterium]|nr:zinc metallopeptidase [Dongiaceae bacterium]